MIDYRGVSNSMGMMIIEDISGVVLPKGTKITVTKDDHQVVWESGEPLVHEVKEGGGNGGERDHRIIIQIAGIAVIIFFVIILAFLL